MSRGGTEKPPPRAAKHGGGDRPVREADVDRNEHLCVLVAVGHRQMVQRLATYRP